MSRRILRIEPGPKSYQVVVSNPDEQRAFEALAEHENRPDVGTWLADLARAYARRYLRERPI
ncbi:MAG: hypothetical protein ABJC13_03380 [Acidobacteriota bacterium]